MLIHRCVSEDPGTCPLMGRSATGGSMGAEGDFRDARILPCGNSMSIATGGFIPSGYAMNGATVFGGSAMRKEARRTLSSSARPQIFFFLPYSARTAYSTQLTVSRMRPHQ